MEDVVVVVLAFGKGGVGWGEQGKGQDAGRGELSWVTQGKGQDAGIGGFS